jgi:hypothetical protein
MWNEMMSQASFLMIKVAKNMRGYSTVIIVLILSLLFVSPVAAGMKTDRERAKLKGPVRTVTTVEDKARGVITYNFRGDEIEEIYKSSAPITEFKKIHTYDAKGRRTKTDYYGHEEDTVPWKTKHYTYDAKGRLIQEIYCLSFGCDDKKVYTYNSKGNLAEETLYYPSSTSVKVRLVHNYDSQGHRTQTTAWEAHGPGLGIGETVQKYDGKGNVRECTTYYTGHKAGDEEAIGDFLPYELITTNKYNSNGDIIEQTTYNAKSEPGHEDECGYPPCRTVYVYEYDPAGNWTKQTEFSCIPTRSGKYECQKVEGETNRTFTYYGTDSK